LSLVLANSTFNPETTTGGNALKFYTSVRLDIRRTGSIKDGDEMVGNETCIKRCAI
jgi:recombination protein RecA